MVADSELYHENQDVLTCAVCACRYPATRRALPGESVMKMLVCGERCRSLLHARLSAAREVEHVVEERLTA
jgi:hypothetical protein